MIARDVANLAMFVLSPPLPPPSFLLGSLWLPKLRFRTIFFSFCYPMFRVSIIPRVLHEIFKPMRNEHGCYEMGRRVICHLVFSTLVMICELKTNKTLYVHFSRWVIKAYYAINLIYRMFNSTKSAWLVNLWSSLACNDYVTTLCEIKQVVREWAEFSYKATFTCSYLSSGF